MSQLQPVIFSHLNIELRAASYRRLRLDDAAGEYPVEHGADEKGHREKKVPVEEGGARGGFVPTLPQARLQALNIEDLRVEEQRADERGSASLREMITARPKRNGIAASFYNEPEARQRE